MKNLITCLALILAVAQAHSEVLSAGSPISGGNGCPDKSLTILQLENRYAFLYDQMEIDSAKMSAAIERKTCSVRIPLNVPKGFKVVVSDISTEGVYNVEGQDNMTMQQTVSFVGSPSRAEHKAKLSGGWDYTYITETDMTKVKPESTCNSQDRDVVVAFNVNSILAKAADSTKKESYAGLYRTDLALQVVPCEPK